MGTNNITFLFHCKFLLTLWKKLKAMETVLRTFFETSWLRTKLNNKKFNF